MKKKDHIDYVLKDKSLSTLQMNRPSENLILGHKL